MSSKLEKELLAIETVETLEGVEQPQATEDDIDPSFLNTVYLVHFARAALRVVMWDIAFVAHIPTLAARYPWAFVLPIFALCEAPNFLASIRHASRLRIGAAVVAFEACVGATLVALPQLLSHYLPIDSTEKTNVVALGHIIMIFGLQTVLGARTALVLGVGSDRSPATRMARGAGISATIFIVFTELLAMPGRMGTSLSHLPGIIAEAYVAGVVLLIVALSTALVCLFEISSITTDISFISRLPADEAFLASLLLGGAESGYEQFQTALPPSAFLPHLDEAPLEKGPIFNARLTAPWLSPV